MNGPSISRKAKILIAIALIGILAGGCGALIRGFWGVSQDCHAWVDGHGYQLVHDHWLAKTRGCEARTPAGEEVYHDEELRNKAIGWAWQFGIFAAGTLPAVVTVTLSALRWRRNPPGAGP
jgi:hypothetical protein